MFCDYRYLVLFFIEAVHRFLKIVKMLIYKIYLAVEMAVIVVM